MKKTIFALILTVGMFGAVSASADTSFSIGWSVGHHGDVVTHFGIHERRHNHHRRHDHHRPYNARTKRWHHRDREYHRGHRRHVERRHHRRNDAYYYHLHGIHRHCSHH